MDDETTHGLQLELQSGGPLTDEDRLERGLGNGPLHVDQATFRSKANRANNYLLDRRCSGPRVFSGIDGINAQDRALQESMGPIVDRSKEHLGPADKAIIQARKLLRQAVKTTEAGGAPDGTGTSYYALRAHEGVLPRAADWRRVTPEMPARRSCKPSEGPRGNAIVQEPNGADSETSA